MNYFAARRWPTALLIAAAVAAGCADARDPMSPGIKPPTTEPPTTAPPTTPPPAQPAAQFNITIRYLGDDATPRQQQAVAAAVARWQSVITGDLTDINTNAGANDCFEGQPALSERIDDIVIFVEFKPIDGVGKILGEAGPCYIRNEGQLPVMGHLQLDQADLVRMEQIGTLDGVVTHEIGHILGIGTLWSNRSLLLGRGGTDPRYTGAAGVQAYHQLGPSDTGIPVEDTGEAGTRDGHWRESVFGNELMTGYISTSLNPLSAMTIASLSDMGYNAQVSAASSYSLAAATQRVKEGLSLNEGEQVALPRFLVDRFGRTTRIEGVVQTTPWRTK